MRQCTLHSHISSSPRTPRRRQVKKPAGRRRRIKNSESSSDGDDSDIGAIKFEPKKTRLPSSVDDEAEPDSEPISPAKSQSSPLKRIQRVQSSDDEDSPSSSKRQRVIAIDSASDSEDAPASNQKVRHGAPVLSSDEELPRKKQRLTKGTRPLSPEVDPLGEVDESGM